MNKRAIMPVVPWALALALPLAFAGCDGSPGGQPEAAATVPPPTLDYPGRHRIPVRLDMRATADGGRAYAIAGAWRGRFVFDGGDDVRCAVDRGDAETIEPGSRHEVRLVCSGAVRLPDDGSRGFRVLEDGQEIASGVVLP